MDLDDYNYPIEFLYRYKNEGKLRSAGADNTMIVEYGITVNVEFIPTGNDSGPIKKIFYKVFKKGTSTIVGGVYERFRSNFSQTMAIFSQNSRKQWKTKHIYCPRGGNKNKHT